MKTKILLLLRVIAAGVLLQTLFFKFTGAEESKWIFSTLGVEPWGRWLSGVFELVSSVLLLVPATQLIGALLGVGVMAGAILSHLFLLGIEIQGDGGLLFVLACTVLLCCTAILLAQREQVVVWIARGRALLIKQK